jgi:hypothetical protein
MESLGHEVVSKNDGNIVIVELKGDEFGQCGEVLGVQDCDLVVAEVEMLKVWKALKYCRE